MSGPTGRGGFDRLAPFAYLLLSWILLLPFSARIGSVLPGPRVDTWQNLWNYWWIQKAFAGGLSPFYTPELFFPYGADLSYHTLSLLNTSPAAILGGILSPVTLLGLSLFLAFPIGAWGMYLLAREVTGSRTGAFLAGFLYAFFPHHLDQIYSHLNLTSSQFLPFFLLFLLRFAEKPARVNGAICALFLALQSYGCFTYMMYGLFIFAVVGAARIAGREAGGKRLRLLGAFAAAGLFFLLLVTPLLVAPLKASLERGGFQYKQSRPTHSASLETYLSPSIFHPIAGRKVADFNRAYEHLPRGGTAYLGFGMIALAGTGLLARRRKMWPYAAGAAIFLVLALGPDLQIRIGKLTGVPLPYGLIQEMPILRFLRVPNRFLIPASLCLGPLAAAGIAALLRWRLGRIAAGTLAALLLLEYLPIPIPVSPITPPPFTKLLAQRSGSGAVLDVPLFLGSQAAIYLYYQTLHGRPITSGYVSIPPPTQGMILEEHPALRWFADTEHREEFPVPPDESPLTALRRLGIGDVVFHKDFDAGRNHYAPPGMEWPKETDGGSWYWKYTTVTGSIPEKRMKKYRQKLEEWLGTPYFEDDRIALFAVPENGSNGELTSGAGGSGE